MLVNADAKGLEVVTAAYLSRDPVMMREVRDFFEFHTDNQNRFGLPSRLIAKKFMFRIIYGGSAYSFSVDADFAAVGFSQKRWQQAIDQFYDKYKGLHQWHISIVQEVIRTGRLIMPTGREFHYSPDISPTGDIKWPRTTILNYPVQGTGADLMMLARISYRARLQKLKKELGLRALLVSTVHDSIVTDCPDEELDVVCKLMFEVFDDIPKNFQRCFGVEFDLPMTCEILYGKNLNDLEEYKRVH